uniref:Uncharacterized protein n=1 Tax=Amphimedon queenslandica TaxID=400682 RepID=A0A1X7UVY2_AMPQE
ARVLHTVGRDIFAAAIIHRHKKISN